MLKTLSRLPWTRWAALTAAYALAAGVVTYPLALHLTTHLAGSPGGPSDTMEFVWSTWWWQHALFDLGQNPAHISVVQWPGGMDFPLLPLMAQAFGLALPLTALAGPVLAYNVVFLLSFVACGLAGYALCAAVSGDRRAGFIGGLIWAFFPNKLGHALTGHLFQLVVFAFPLAVLAWWRLLRAPTRRRAVWAALALWLASTVHPIYLAYFVAPWLLVAVGVGLWQERRAFLTPARVRAVALAGGLYALLLLPLVAPALIQTARGGLAYLAPERGTVELSIDALAYLIPAPRQPLVALTPLADLARAVAGRENETLGYLGVLPLLLAGVAWRRRAPASGVWWVLGLVGVVLALGPLLKFGGQLVRVPVELEQYPLPLPYALLAHLPFFEWSRAPGRLTVLVALALAVLAALGYAALAVRPHPFWRSRVWLGLVSAAIVFEYLVVFPFPLTPATRPAPVLALAAVADHRPVLPLPWPDNDANLRALYWQTLHAHPLIGGRVYREVPGGQDRATFLGQLLLGGDGPDIVPFAPAAEREAVLAAEAGWVLYDTAADPTGAARAQLEARLGPPQSADAAAALFAVSAAGPLPVEALVWAIGPGWGAAPNGARRLPDAATLYTYSGAERAGALQLAVQPEAGPVRLQVALNGQPLPVVVVGGATDTLRLVGRLTAGLNVITLAVEALDSGAPAPALLVNAATWDDALPEPAFAAIFGAVLALDDARVPLTATVGARLPVVLAWQALSPAGEDLHTFIHLLAADGSVAAQVDGPPLGGVYPTSHWRPGEHLVETVWLDLPADLPQGAYTLVGGLYRWPSLERLPVTAAAQVLDDRVVLGSVTLTP